ncbi:DUF808 domain-containing protein [Brachybacterium sp. EF45031]|uniref:DUF808 domain-containing protein n=1 Tax=Brachybacterium sillae TaxID=2810536 RepID=UPI00217CF3AF|nr:DUF808 domain-containing protein [Brachybacterium sillae]MCS6711140.1 DUF808 domain-containing protein [Brachybacterium sillae]
MAGGLAALLDDVAALARLAAASADDVAAASARASAKAAGVVVDDAAVTPQYVRGIEPMREVPIIAKIARGSLINKLLVILPVALLLSQFLPWLLTPLLMLGGTYLCFEGAEKLWEHLRGHHAADQAAVEQGPEAEKKIVSSAVRTDLILSAEIMVIALNEVADQPLLNRAMILIVVGVAITLLVYGAVALLVKIDDIGLGMMEKESEASQRTGRMLVAAMPKVMTAISWIGMIAMLWVGGHIILVGLDELGWHAPYAAVHHLEEAVHGVPGVGAALAWLVNTFFSFLLGLAWGAVIVALLHLLPFGKKHGADGHGDATHGHGATAQGAGSDSAAAHSEGAPCGSVAVDDSTGGAQRSR